MENYQKLFHQEWQGLHDPHVRSLAWMLTSPSMLAKDSPVWHHKIANLILPEKSKLHAWLLALDQQPTELHEALALHKHRRLGHYAENLLAFYLRHAGLLYLHGLQVHEDNFSTIGEFDFLLHEPDGLLHWEIATKFYLFEPGDELNHRADLADYLGPNLADTLAAKMDKIFHHQLALSHHLAAQKLLPKRVIAAKALIKGWLFYREQHFSQMSVEGVAEDHCRGYWWALKDLERLTIPYFLILERLQWLAPVQTRLDSVMEQGQLHDAIFRHFQRDNAPIMLALMYKNGDVMQEYCRGMVVPDDWLIQARKKRQDGA
jgi:hypothetical protein